METNSLLADKVNVVINKGVVMSEKAQQILEQYIIPFGWKLLAAAAIFIIGKWVARLVSNLLERAMTHAKVNLALVTFTKHVVYYALWILVAIAALNKLGVETTSFVALVGAAGLAIGLALQGALSNFAAGVMILIFQPFDIGDWIEGGGAAGKVVEIQMFNTIIHTDDKKVVIVPNAKITGDKLVVYGKLK
jgi:small conductance mechanosensitive channel